MFFKKMKNNVNYLQEWFALSGVIKQLSVVIVFGLVIVLISGLFIGSIEKSYMVFVDPPALSLMKDKPFNLLYSFFLMMLGLIVTGFVISVLSASLENTFRDVKKGRLKYLGSGHSIIINSNHKILKILQEINLLHKCNGDYHDVVIFIKSDNTIEKLQAEILKEVYEHLHIFIRYGDTLSWQRYNELSIKSVNSIIILGCDEIKDPFVRDNNNLRIMNLLFSNEKFVTYMKKEKQNTNL